eukprot:CAMPEP_0206531956 /NCGR_PEP_ID=MMETSP0325_2-20121206/4068_1 /ASSEMBLY_ACC=CAM_ASM_000347 /TAXON_ID=2866 /ORGANISM="Crypthecodinium cohnii, Strain Seligo" /LENGTH=83 /DNA_ID=CAMNT_0054028287 /DNA_START=164 /DNA_END=415 /DNA_ORIENTATION=-
MCLLEERRKSSSDVTTTSPDVQNAPGERRQVQRQIGRHFRSGAVLERRALVRIFQNGGPLFLGEEMDSRLIKNCFSVALVVAE